MQREVVRKLGVNRSYVSRVNSADEDVISKGNNRGGHLIFFLSRLILHYFMGDRLYSINL